MDNLNRTALGLDENVAAVLAYALGWITGVALLLIERENQFVRFHAIQSTLVFGVLCGVWFIGLSIPFVGWIISLFVIPVVSAAIWLLMMFMAYQGRYFKLPFAGKIAEQRSAL